MKDLNEIRAEISQATGIPTELLMQDSAEECLKAAKAVIGLKKKFEDERVKTPQEQFGEWFNDGKNESEVALDGLEESVRQYEGHYPSIKDAGEAQNMPDGRTTTEQFAEWFNDVSAISGQQFMDRHGII